NQIRAEVEERGQAEEPPPRHRQQRVVRAERGKITQPGAHHVEAAVAVEQPPAAFSRHHRAESQVAHVGLILIGRNLRKRKSLCFHIDVSCELISFDFSAPSVILPRFAGQVQGRGGRVSVLMQALILAGGEGARLRPLTIHTPKPIVPLANRPFLYYQLDLLKQAGIKDITLSLSYQPNKIESIFGAGEDLGLRIRYVVEATPMGTAGAYKYAQERLNQTTIIFNGDILTDIDIAELVTYHREKRAVATVAVVPVENPSAYGLVEAGAGGRAGRLLGEPQPEEGTRKTIHAALHVITPGV